MAHGDRYKKGGVEIHDCAEYLCDPEDSGVHIGGEPGIAQLGHQCGPWVIGGRKEAQQLIDDLTALLPQLRD